MLLTFLSVEPESEGEAEAEAEGKYGVSAEPEAEGEVSSVFMITIYSKDLGEMKQHTHSHELIRKEEDGVDWDRFQAEHNRADCAGGKESGKRRERCY